MVNELGLERKLVNIWLIGSRMEQWQILETIVYMEWILIQILDQIGQKMHLSIDVRLNSAAHYILWWVFLHFLVSLLSLLLLQQQHQMTSQPVKKDPKIIIRKKAIAYTSLKETICHCLHTSKPSFNARSLAVSNASSLDIWKVSQTLSVNSRHPCSSAVAVPS